MVTKEQLIEKRNKVFEMLISEGWDYDDARSATMTAGVNVDDQPETKHHPLVAELANLHLRYAEEQKPITSKELSEDAKKISEVMLRVEAKKASKSDIAFLVEKNLAHYEYDDPESNAPTGAVIGYDGDGLTDKVYC